MGKTEQAIRKTDKEILDEFVDYLKKEKITITFEDPYDFEEDPYNLKLYEWIDSEYDNQSGPKINNEFLNNVENEYIDNNSYYFLGEYLFYEIESIISKFLEKQDYNVRDKDYYKNILNDQEHFDLYQDYIEIDYNTENLLENYTITTDILMDNANMNTEGSNLQNSLLAIREMMKNEEEKTLFEKAQNQNPAEFVLNNLNNHALNALGFLNYKYQDIYYTENLKELLEKALKEINAFNDKIQNLEYTTIPQRIDEENDYKKYQTINTFKNTISYFEKASESIDETLEDLKTIERLKNKNKEEEEDKITKENIKDHIDELTPMLFKSQGYEITDLCDDEKIKNSKFLKSFLTEMINLYDIGVYTATTILSLTDIQEIINKKEITIDKDTVFGMFDPACGGGSVMDIELEKDFTLPLSYINLSNTNNSSFGYSTTSVYGSLV